MQENDFEKSVQLKMQEFEIAPAAEVWNAVQARISTEKHRRRIVLLLFIALILAGGVVTAVLIKDMAVNKTRGHLGKTVSAKDNFKTKSAATYVPSQTKVSGGSLEIKKHDKMKNFSGNKTSFANTSEKQVNPKFSITNNIIPQPKVYNQTRVKSNNSSIVNDVTLAKELALHKYYKSKETLLQDSLLFAANKLLPLKDSNKHSVASVSKKIKSAWSMGFTLDAGLSNNVSGLHLFTAKSAAIYNYSAPNQTSSIGSAFNYAAPLSYKHSASFGIGVSATKSLSKRASYSIGVSYHYYSATSAYSNRVDSSIHVYDSTLQRYSNADRFYQSGSGNTFVNRYHLIRLPVHFNYQINKKGKPFLLTAGLLPSFLIASNALYLNNQLQVYYREKSQFHQFILMGEAGFLKTVTSGKAKFEIGPALQFGLNSLTKQEVINKQHLFFAGLKTRLIIK